MKIITQLKKFFIVLFLCLTTSLCIAQSYEDYYTIDGVYYSPNSEYGASAAVTKKTGNVIIPETVLLPYGDNTRLYTVNGIAYCNSEVTSIHLPNTINEIYSYAFSDCTGLTSVNIPNSVTLIGMFAFMGCSSLTSITLPNSITHIDFGTFQDCYNLTNITIPESVNIIDSYSFYNCKSLKSINIPKNVTHIGYDVFVGCENLKKIYIDDLSQFCKIITEDVIFSRNNLYLNGKLLTELKIPNDVTELRDYIFMGCNSISTVIIPNNVVKIGTYAFDYCENLKTFIIDDGADTLSLDGLFNNNVYLEYLYLGRNITGNAYFPVKSVTIGPSITEITKRFIYYCSHLSNLNLPSTLKSIGEEVFNEDFIEHLNVPCHTPPTISETTFTPYTYRNCILSVPILSAYKYKSALGWKNFFANKEEVAIEYNENVNVSIVNYNYENDLPRGGSSIFIIPNDSLTFHIRIPENEELDSVLFNNVDVTPQLADSVTYFSYTTSAITSQSSIKIKLKGSDTSNIKNIENNDAIEMVRFDIYGRRLNKKTKGINIIKLSDGTTRKEFVK